ncbi:MAG: PrsW family intramembrane metalloprotease, partial [Deltaproteobacteria bacterium]|nr:PrsW family intramembrane metalloprotease [Deltaproteobacteria bacterium]
MQDFVSRLAVGILPVLLFLVALIYLDSYKLIKLRWVLLTIALGGLVAAVPYGISLVFFERSGLSLASYSRYVAPPIEETVKALLLVYLIRSHRIGFLVDAAIYGFAVGAGFAVIENLVYLQQLPDSSFVVWLVRGCGTAIMHGGATAIFAIAAKALSDRDDVPRPLAYLPGLVVAIVVHSAYNHFFLSPILSTAGILLVLPPLVFLVFARSERGLEDWLEVGFDADTELLALIHSGELSASKVGRYLEALKEGFRGEIVADLLCYLRIHVELSLRAKGLLMMRESGFNIEPDEDTRAQFAEL